ncbi:hypothetical protein Hanom_Chr13g01205651 [Helianthus anomalus]
MCAAAGPERREQRETGQNLDGRSSGDRFRKRARLGDLNPNEAPVRSFIHVCSFFTKPMDPKISFRM